MKCNFTFLAVFMLAMLGSTALAQRVLTLPGGARGGMMAFARDTVAMGYEAEVRQISVMANADYTIEAINAPWLSVERRAADRLVITSTYNMGSSPRYALVPFAVGDTTLTLAVMQAANTAAATVKGDTKLTISGGTASSSQSGEEIAKSYDGDASTYYHSAWYSTTMPVTLTYTLSGAPHVDYLVYTPRPAGNTNGNFGEITIYYSTTAAPAQFVEVQSNDLGFGSSATRISLGESGLDNVHSVRIVVRTGAGNLASCAEMAFYAYDATTQTLLDRYFADNLRTKLREGVSEADIAGISEPFVKQLATVVKAGGYSTEYRVGEFEAYPNLTNFAARYKTTQYNPYENPTGIYFTAGAPIVVIAEGIGDDPVSLIVKNFGKATSAETQPESSFPLKNGVNLITPTHRGNGYVSYYTDNAAAPKVRLHFALATENGYFDLERGDDNEKWKLLLANAASDIMDIRAPRIQGAYPVERFRQACPDDVVALLQLMDTVVYLEHEVMGLVRYGEPRNRQFSRVVWGNYMYADGVGAAVNDTYAHLWINPSLSTFELWGYAHELGHNNQIRPDFLYAGCGETTNNIYSAWVEFKLKGTGNTSLETSVSGRGESGRMKGGSFNIYLEESVRKGTPWQLVDGIDYYGTKFDTVTVKNEDYEGNKTTDTTVAYRNFDHFTKLIPLWQLQLYGNAAGLAPDVYAKVFETMRNTTMEGTASSGKYQLRFIKLVCDSTGLDFLPFFEKAGLLRPINAYIADYSSDWLKINEEMIASLKAYVTEKGYPTAPGEVNYITALNWETYAKRLPLANAATNAGTEKITDSRGTRIRVQHSVWENAVAFETYDASDNLIRISMQGLGGPTGANTYTEVLWPTSSTEQAAYIKAVGWDGTRTVCYRE